MQTYADFWVKALFSIILIIMILDLTIFSVSFFIKKFLRNHQQPIRKVICYWLPVKF